MTDEETFLYWINVEIPEFLYKCSSFDAFDKKCQAWQPLGNGKKLLTQWLPHDGM